jgi:hypothetical protein
MFWLESVVKLEVALQCTPLCKLGKETNPIFLADGVGEWLFSSPDRYSAVF